MADKKDKGKGGEAKKKKSYQIHKLYEKKGDALTRKNKSCPKCGEGFFMAAHKGRLTCGKCHYTEFQKKE